MLISGKIIAKLKGIEERYFDLRFYPVASLNMEFCETREYLSSEPKTAKWRPARPGEKWGDAWVTAWFRGQATIPPECQGKKVFIRSKVGGVETLLFVDGEPMAVVDGPHKFVLLTLKGVAGKAYEISLESYSGHGHPGAHPTDSVRTVSPKSQVFDSVELALEREDVSAFVFDFMALRQLSGVLDDNYLRKHKILKCLASVYTLVDALPDESGESSWRPKLAEARKIMKPLLELKNGPTTPWLGVIGHSHLDTAWLWPLRETWRKAARTFSSVINLLDQYPEFLFIQNVPCHNEMLQKGYPSLFKRFQEKVKEGRIEPNGAMWVEPDCNIPSGESFVRQLLVGQMANREMFGYTADTLWLPDVFGYSASLPQLLRGAHVEFFCTTKIAWNDTTRFPYDTFIWKGIDGTSVLAHFNSMVGQPGLDELTHHWNWVQHKDIQDRRFVAAGHGDGGGGPIPETIELLRRAKDLEGCPKVRFMTIREFMKGVQKELTDLPVWCGELYLECHRGTTTSQAAIKKGNRQLEIALRDAEFFCVLSSLGGEAYPRKALLEIWKELLTNQFHDILPGSSIKEVNDEAVASFARCIKASKELTQSALKTLVGKSPKTHEAILLLNTLSWDRSGETVLRDVPEGIGPMDSTIVCQRVQSLNGTNDLVIDAPTIPALGSVLLALGEETPQGSSSFKHSVNSLETPFAVARFDKTGRIDSLVDKSSGREIVRRGGALNTFWIGEDVPFHWDNWDIDPDQAAKMRSQNRLIEREIVAEGPLQLRIRSRYEVGANSSITQDIVFHSTTPRIDFETVVDWNETHQLLKAGFELDLLADFARHEIQYGYAERSTHTNYPADRARFEVCAHKWTDLSEPGFGVALLNDCKYGIGVERTEMRLTLLKSGTHPDPRAEKGRHEFTYSLMPHACGFSVESVVRPAYELNIAPISYPTSVKARTIDALFSIDATSVIVEAIKWAEDGKGFIVRLYEASKTQTSVTMTFNIPVKRVSETNLLEEEQSVLKVKRSSVNLTLRPFEVKTLRCEV